jgi:hypothetical protein
MRHALIAFSFALAAPAAIAQDAPATDYPAVAEAISTAMRANHYDPAELELPGYAEVEARIAVLADTAADDEAFLSGFQDVWLEHGPFSHVELRRAQAPVEEMLDFFDNMRVGGGGAVLSWEGEIAVLTVNTMMGLDTIEEIDAAYVEIAERGASGLVIDLRANTGGAFAVKPLVEGVIEAPMDAGGFVSQRWNAEMDRAPTLADAAGVAPWTGWSVRAFWAAVQTDRLTRIRFEPGPNRFDGPVYVLVSERTASAAEMAADALKASGRAQLIGETTRGAMLSQTVYDIPGGFHLSLPIADYYSFAHGRIEGVGVTPDIALPADQAMEAALARLR